MSQNGRRTSLARVASLLLLFLASARMAHAQLIQRHIVMRVDFQDSGTTPPRYSRQQVQQLLDSVADLFTTISNNTVKTEFVVTDVFRLPKNSASYDSQGSIQTTMQDAIASAPAAVTALFANNVNTILVVLSQKSDRG